MRIITQEAVLELFDSLTKEEQKECERIGFKIAKLSKSRPGIIALQMTFMAACIKAAENTNRKNN